MSTVGARRRLGEVCRVQKGTTITKKQATPGPIPVVAGGTRPTYFHNTHNRSAGVVTISASGANAGYVNYWDDPIWASDCTTVEVSDPDRMVNRYLFHFLKSVEATTIASLRRGAAQPHVYAKDIQEIEIPLPPIEEQRRIASILDAADALRTKRRRALEKLDSLGQSIFIDMFGIPTINHNEWPVEELAAVVATGSTVTYGIVQAGEEFPGGTPYIRTGDIVGGQIRLEGLRHTDPEIAERFPRSRVAAGEIVMSIRATVGTTAVVPVELDGANLTQGTARIAPGDRAIGPYLLQYLRNPNAQDWIQRQVKGATFREITLSRLRELPVALPPLELQRRFAERLSSASELSRSGWSSRSALEVLFASLQHRAFRGEL